MCRLLPVTLDFICHLPCFLFPSLLPVAPSFPVMSQLNGLEGRDAVCRELSLSQSELNRNCPLLLELIRSGRHKHSQVRPPTNQLAALPSLLVCWHVIIIRDLLASLMTRDQLCSLTLVFSDLSHVQGDTGGHVCKVSRVCVCVHARPPGVQPGVGVETSSRHITGTSMFFSKEPSQKQIAHARRKFDSYDKVRNLIL